MEHTHTEDAVGNVRVAAVGYIQVSMRILESTTSSTGEKEDRGQHFILSNLER